MELRFSWKAVAAGILITAALGPVFRFVIPSFTGILSIIVAAVVCGYIADSEYPGGALNGAIMGAAVGLINILIVYLKTGSMNAAILSILIYALAGDVSLGILGGASGSVLRSAIES
ncbi:hypothetical protein FVF72_03970 [Methanothermobacter sp. KEPCO-1]|uniref:DUF5518 domain-containing protein n=1 Tax=Methanothermobacter marburgensis (strain ATCC BAA-927 / DSM 2133 / JCM 14651 / NBRC 100331 / OCM 82 / Marburg) TaxID=79929 RepID=D9PU25_METTM|nr:MULTISPECIES: DUF5518 domain-containing protein [Methanothermobacter]ADL57723.1 conserved hypothetical protein [Methanothermobacter marburgensis str. Marburg]QEF94387.1 hypothetical protein FVF72_03970 [Methanothermobacter sp. KEPCO-1]WBF09948.1 DUF5518 domain-containing protein [Methanothermobacter marburgensis]